MVYIPLKMIFFCGINNMNEVAVFSTPHDPNNSAHSAWPSMVNTMVVPSHISVAYNCFFTQDNFFSERSQLLLETKSVTFICPVLKIQYIVEVI